MAMILGGRGGVSSEINVTSLIDVLLVLLIIFMVLPHPSLGERAEIPLKATDSDPRPPEKPVIIHIQDTSAGQRPSVKVNEEEVGWESLEAYLQKLYLRRIDKVAFLKGDPEIDFQYVAEVVDATHHAGVTHVGLLGN